ncbi:MerR family transcriptional regulator [Methylobacterium sp. 77]|uniref:MerR family transcriptional regulator n=1 Tax=Methylobacterium sp. 77 TaxID=1101192 RepID=UPI000561ABA9|nr:MerR family transcriptional regulator [Methylobacterium sp. 77]
MESRDTGEKRPGAFRTISEVADEIDVPQHVLRFWETKFVQIRPVKRAGGRRYYRPEDVDLIKGIRRLLHDQGYTIRGAQRVLKENGIRFVQSVGRGEAEVAAPTSRDLEAGEAESDDEAAPVFAGDERRDADRQVLLAVLDDLHACRDALNLLRDPPDVA